MTMINPKLPAFWYGGDYNPEQWPEEIWAEDMRLFKTAGINIATVNIFSWSLLQTAEGSYSFDRLDKILGMLADNNIYACLATATAAQPHWMSKKYPEILPVDMHGRKKEWGGRVNFCPNSRKYREFAVDLVARLAKRYAGHPALVLWHIANEYGTYCYCENCARAFRKWLQKRYGTIEEVNARWYTSFWSQTLYDWEEIPTPSMLNVLFERDGRLETVAQGMLLDYQRFMSESTLKCYTAEYETIKKYTPDLPVTTNLMGPFKPLDYFSWAKKLDVVSWDSYPVRGEDFRNTAFRHALMRGLKKGQPFILMEQAPSQTNWRYHCAQKRPGEMRLLSYQAIAHGAETIMFFQLRQSRGGPEKYHSAVIAHAGHEKTRVFQEISGLGRELRDLGSQLLDATGYAQAAVLFAWENWWALENSMGPSRGIDYVKEATRYYRALAGQHVGVDVIGLEDDFDKYNILAAPYLYMLKPGIVDRLEKFVAQGGTLVITTMSGLVDENDLVTLGGYPGELRNLAGIWVEELDALPPEEKNRLSVTGSFRNSFPSAVYSCSLLFDVIHPAGAQPLAVYERDYYAGRPAVTVNNYGSGRVYYIGTCPENKYLDVLTAVLCREQGLKPLLPSVPPGIEVTKRIKGNASYLFILNHDTKEQSVELPSGSHTELLSGKTVRGKVKLPPYGTLILHS